MADPRMIDLSRARLTEPTWDEMLEVVLKERASEAAANHRPEPPVESLWLIRREIQVFPRIIVESPQFETLVSLFIGHNQLRRIPREIGRLAHLRFLGVSNNQLTTLPSEMAQLRSLESFYADRQFGDERPHPLFPWIEKDHKQCQNFLQNVLLVVNAPVDNCRRACLCLLALKRFHSDENEFLRTCPRELILVMARYLWSTLRHERKVWANQAELDVVCVERVHLQGLGAKIAYTLRLAPDDAEQVEQVIGDFFSEHAL